MRGLLKKRGGGLRTGKATWHWRFCILHSHALAIHEGKDCPKALRSSVALKHVLRVEPATHEEAMGREEMAFSLHTTTGRTYVFCTMGEMDLSKWMDCIRTNMAQSSNLKRRYGLESADE